MATSFSGGRNRNTRREPPTMAFYISEPKLLFETTEISTHEFDSTGVKLYIFIHNEVRDFDKNSTQPEISQPNSRQ